MKNNSYIKQIVKMSRDLPDRRMFHQEAGKLLQTMAKDKDFWRQVFKINFTDKNYLQRKWSMYEIPFLYVFESDDFYVKAHLFVPLETRENNIAASAVHHHNNYLLTTYAAFGSGYETFLFEKDFQVNHALKEANLRIRTRFTQKDKPVHMVDAWEPHVVINPVTLSATLVLWSPDKKRATDSLRSNPLLKALKTPLRKLIYLMGLGKKVGIASKDTFQFYTSKGKFKAIPEDEFFAPTRAAVGAEVDNYSIQTVFAFMQRMELGDKEFLENLKTNTEVPAYFHKWIDMILKNEPIPDTYAKPTINIPGGIMRVDDIIKAGS